MLFLRHWIAVLAIAPFAQAGDLFVVVPGSQGSVSNLQRAINLAAPGDTLLLKEGAFGYATVENKGLVFVAEVGALSSAKLIALDSLGSDQELYFSRIITRFIFPYTGRPAKGGQVLIEDCRNLGNVSFGVLGLDWIDNVVLVDSRFMGATGGHTAFKWPNHSTDVFAYHSFFAGGGGYDGCGWTCQAGGWGGTGLWVSKGLLYTHRVVALAGWAGCGCPPGSPGTDIGAPFHLPSLAPLSRLKVPDLEREGSTSVIQITGAPGTVVALLSSSRQATRFIGQSTGALHLANPMQVTPLGSIPASGEILFSRIVPALPPGVQSQVTYYQARLTPAALPSYLSNPSAMVVIDSSF